jgi:tRNA A-37 threonylcarbamoyl transferase component Bud32
LKALTLNEYRRLVDNSVILEEDGHGLKVLESSEGYIIKIFRQKRMLSSAVIKSYASRFVKNARTLNKLGINTVQVKDVLFCKPIKRTLVFYQPIPGRPLREVLQNREHVERLVGGLAVFLAELHEKGVLFRSIHLSNVIISESLDTFGLIDFADMKISSHGLSRQGRLRNFRHLTCYKVDQELIRAFGIARFMTLYFENSSLAEKYKQQFLERVQEMFTGEGKV